MKKLLALVLCLVLAAIPAITLADAAEAKIIYAISDDPEVMDPTLCSYSRSSIVLQQLFRGLYKLGEDGSIVPALAEGYTVSDDGLVYTFTLRDGCKWSDGSDLTMQDFYYSWTRVLNPETGSKAVSGMWDIKNAKAYYNGECTLDEVGLKLIDDKTLEVTLENPAPWFVSLTSTTVFLPVKQSAIESGDGWTKTPETYVCDGPFYPVEFKTKERLVFKKNPYYIDADSVKIDTVEIVIIEAAETELAAYQNGEINVADNLSANAMMTYKDTDEYHSVDRIGIRYMDFNTEHKPFDNKLVRQAFAMAIDRQLLIDRIIESSESALLGFIPVAQPSLSDPTKSYREVAGNMFEEDVAKAQELLAEAGYPNGEGIGTVQFVVQASNSTKDLAQALQSMWKTNLNVDVEIVTYESKVFWGELDEGNFDIDINGFTCDYLDPSAHLVVFTTGSNCYENRWDDPVFDEMVASSMQELDQAKREQLIIEAEAYLADQMPACPILSFNDDYLVKPNITGIIKNYIGHICFEYAEVN